MAYDPNFKTNPDDSLGDLKKKLNDLYKKDAQAQKSLEETITGLEEAILKLIDQLKNSEQRQSTLSSSLSRNSDTENKTTGAMEDLAKKLEEFAASSLGVEGKNQGAADFVFKQQIPLVGLKARMLTSIGREIEKAITFFTDDLSAAFSATVDAYAERLQRELFGDIKVYTDKLKGRQKIRDEIISSLGPLAGYANPQLLDSLYFTKTRLVLDPSVEGGNRAAKHLNKHITDYADKNAPEVVTSWFDGIMRAIRYIDSAGGRIYDYNQRLGSKKEEKL